MTPDAQPAVVEARPGERRASREKAAFQIQELHALHASIRSIFILLLVLTVCILGYMAVRIFVLGDVDSYAEFVSLCFFAVACVALSVGQLFCLRRIRHDTREKIERMTFVDELTDAYNYRFLEQRLIEELQRAKRHGTPLSVVYFDIDQFKQVNDRFGHDAGNMVLRKVAQICRVSARGEDFVGRLGGDEFLLVLPATDASGALVAAERVRQRLNGLDYHDVTGCAVDFLGFSMGVASFPANAQATDDLIRAADEAMYRAKRSGGNRVCL
jgi:diguanylate cyclase (GGDEF)-like protein